MNKISRRTVVQGIPAIAVGAAIPAVNAWADAEQPHVRWPLGPDTPNWMHFVKDPEENGTTHVFIDSFDFVPLIPEDIESYYGSFFQKDDTWVIVPSFDGDAGESYADSRHNAMRFFHDWVMQG